MALQRASSSDPWLLSEVTKISDGTGLVSNREYEIAAGATPGAFVRADAVAYAKKYSCNGQLPGACANKVYSYFKKGGDCTNFVSQALFAAGMDMRFHPVGYQSDNDYWWWSRFASASESWRVVSSFKDFMVNNSHRAEIHRITDLKSSYSGVKPGDVYLVDLHGDGISHAMLALGDGQFAAYYDRDYHLNYQNWGTRGSKIAQHTIDRVNAPWNWGYRVANPNERTKIKYYVVHFTGQGVY